jgi:hypothetical protein
MGVQSPSTLPTLVAVCIFKGGPCVQMTWSLALIDVISDETLQDALFID